MPIDRPTFSESWHRVSNLKARLRATVQVRRQRFRGQTYYVLQDASGTEFFKLAGPAYHFIGLLDGKKTVAQAGVPAMRRSETTPPPRAKRFNCWDSSIVRIC